MITAQIKRAAAATSQQAELEGQRVLATRFLAPGCTTDGKNPAKTATRIYDKASSVLQVASAPTGLLRTIHSSDSSNGDASRNQIHECDDSQIQQGEGQHHKTPGPLHAVAQNEPGRPAVAVRAAAPNFSRNGFRK